MSSDIAISVQNLSKCYQIYDRPQDRLKQPIVSRVHQLIGRPPKNYYREFWALKDISFEIKKGKTVGIIGRNGSGKSTLLQIICGTIAPSSGAVETNGRIAALLELGTGFNFEFTGRENVYMNGAVLGLSKQEIDTRFDDIATFADIGQFIEQPVKTYSSGMLVRLAFAVAINVDPQILIVDEALSVGDELFQRKCFSRIEAIKNSGATILFVSHSGSTVVELCDHAVLIDSGDMLAMGVPKEIVGVYQKLIYAPQEKQNTIRDKILTTHANRHSFGTSQTHQQPEIKHAIEDDSDEFLDPHLEPKSTLIYESHGAYISDPEIYNLSGKKVNCLKRGKSYRYLYKVRFDKAAANVRFAMLIKTASGLELGGAVSASGLNQSIPYLAPGSIVDVEFQFTCNLNPGSYYLNAGVRGTNGDEETYLHRVIDIYIIKVMPATDNTATALVDFNIKPKFEIMNDTLQEIEKA